MGEYAEMMLDGTLCEGCGVYLGTNNGFVTYCKGCQRTTVDPSPKKKATCPNCGKRVKEIGLAQHIRDAHGVKP